MTAWRSATQAAPAAQAAQATHLNSDSDSDSAVLRRYYRERDHLTSPEGIMKVISVILCIVSSTLLFSSGSSADLPLLVTCGASVVLGCAAALACLYASAALSLSAYAPTGCFFTDLILSTVISILLLVIAVLNMTYKMVRVIDYVHGPLALVTAGVVMGSAVVGYVSVTRRWDRARGPSVEPRRAPPTEQEV